MDSNRESKLITQIKRGDEVIITSSPEMQEENDNKCITQGKLQSELTSKYLNMDIFRVINNELYMYDEARGCLEKLPSGRDAMKLISLLPGNRQNRISSKTIAEVIQRLKYQEKINIENDDVNANPRYINCKNGVVDLENGNLLNHNISYNFTYCVNAKYIEQSQINLEIMEKFAETSLEGDQSKGELLMEIIGYLISDYNNAKKAFIFLGKPHSGKSLLSKIISNLLGGENISNIPFHKLGDRFSNAELSTHKLNINAELDSTPIRRISNFKAIVGNDTLSAEFKGKPLFSFKARTKLLFCGNYMPELKDVEITEAFVDRFVFLIFNRSTPKDEIDYDLEEKIMEEIDSIFTVAIRYLRNLINKNFQFIVPEDSKKFIEEYSSRQNNVMEFVNEECDLGEYFKVHTKTLYKAYQKFCQDNCIIEYTQNKFGEYIASIGGVQRCRFRQNGINARGFIGINIKELSLDGTEHEE